MSTSEEPADPKRSRLVLWLWAAGLSLLLAMGLVCWRVVVPVRTAQRVLPQVQFQRGGSCPPDRSAGPDRAVEALGGRAEAARSLSLYLLLPGREPADRQKAVYVLGSCGQSGVPPLRRALRDPESAIREEAAGVLQWMGPDAAPAVPELAAALGDANANTRCHAAEALGQIGPAAAPAVPALVKCLRDGDSQVRIAAMDTLGRLGKAARAAAPELVRAAAGPDLSVRAAAARALVRISAAEEGAEVLVRILAGEIRNRVPVFDWTGAGTAAWMEIGEAGAAAVPALERALSSPDEPVRQAGLLGAMAIGSRGERLVPRIVELAGSEVAGPDGKESADRRRQTAILAINALQVCGPPARAVPVLEGLSAHGDEDVRRAAADALLRIRQTAPAK